MKPYKAMEIIDHVGGRVPGRVGHHSRFVAPPQKIGVTEWVAGNGLQEEFNHDGQPRPDYLAAGSFVEIKIRLRPTPRERLREIRGVATQPVATHVIAPVMETLAELGYLKPEEESVMTADSDNPQLELIPSPRTRYNPAIGQIVTTISFRDHNPQK